MNESIDIEVVRAEALRKLGRNIVNFSKIEAAFKRLLLASNFEGTGKTIPKQLDRKQKMLHKQTLGRLVQDFNSNVLGDSMQSEPTTNAPAVGLAVSLKLTFDNPDFVKEKKRELSKIVAERNRLIHQDLALLDTRSVEDYRNLIIRLDEQNPRLLAQLEELRWMINSISEGLEALQNHVFQSQADDR